MKLLTSMAKGETNRVSEQLTWAREHGVIPWDWIVDETWAPERVNAFTDPQDYVEVVKRSYRKDRWTDQPEWIEVWSEKGTVRGTLAPVLNAYGITLRVLHGYGSTTAVYEAAQDSLSAGDDKLLTVLYVGDHDPSGLHMSEVDLPRRLREYGGVVDLVRIALTDQDTATDLPSFATETKRLDARYRWYLKRYGARCWELDALSPVVLRDRLEGAILARIDHDAWRRADIAERAECESLASVLDAWPGMARSSISGQAPE
jgi:hypothetical protein